MECVDELNQFDRVRRFVEVGDEDLVYVQVSQVGEHFFVAQEGEHGLDLVRFDRKHVAFSERVVGQIRIAVGPVTSPRLVFITVQPSGLSNHQVLVALEGVDQAAKFLAHSSQPNLVVEVHERQNHRQDIDVEDVLHPGRPLMVVVIRSFAMELGPEVRWMDSEI